MRSAATPKPAPVAGFRLKLLLAMMLVVTAVAAAGFLLAQRSAGARAQHEFEREFQERIAALQAVAEVRNAVLAERCRQLAIRPRIHAALEDGALDLLYPSARTDLADIMEGPDAPSEPGAYPLRAQFYRFLGASGRVIPPRDPRDVGILSPEQESRLSLPRLPDRPEIGYLPRRDANGHETIDELIAMPIVSTETGDVIAAIVLGCKPGDPAPRPAGAGPQIRNGLCVQGQVHLPGLDPAARAEIAAQITPRAASSGEGSFTVRAGTAPYLLFHHWLNPDSLYPPASEVILYPLTGLLSSQRHLLWQFTAALLLLLAGALLASNYLAARLSMPVEKLAVDSEQNLNERRRAEHALDLTHKELERSARFSADASHQLKTPVTVLRAGLEELLAEEKLPSGTREEVSALIHQTFRLTTIVEDLLLLSRLDAGRLQLSIGRVDLRALIDGGLDDLGTLPDDDELQIENDLPATLFVSGEKRYISLILQNLLENARKYNRPGGRIHLAAREEGPWAVVTVGNTGRPIPAEARDRIFERFHRGGMGENVPGHGLGLNLARELARLHGGDLRLVRSDDSWTEFELRLRGFDGGASA